MKGGKRKFECGYGNILFRATDRMQSIMTRLAVMMILRNKLLFRSVKGNIKNYECSLKRFPPPIHVKKWVVMYLQGDISMEGRKGWGSSF